MLADSEVQVGVLGEAGHSHLANRLACDDIVAWLTAQAPARQVTVLRLPPIAMFGNEGVPAIMPTNFGDSTASYRDIGHAIPGSGNAPGMPSPARPHRRAERLGSEGGYPSRYGHRTSVFPITANKAAPLCPAIVSTCFTSVGHVAAKTGHSVTPGPNVLGSQKQGRP